MDALACIGSLSVATATGTLRSLGDRHYTTDALAGALVGFAFGYGIPVLLHYSMPVGAARIDVRPMARHGQPRVRRALTLTRVRAADPGAVRRQDAEELQTATWRQARDPDRCAR